MIHYDPKNWVGILLDIPKSRVFRTLFFDVLGAGAWAALVVWVEKDYFKVAVPLGPSFLSILGIILGLLLVFRTNTAYDRWWEGRKLWGQLVNVSRGMAHYLDAALPAGAPARATYAEGLARYPQTLAEHLRTLGQQQDGVHGPNAVLRTLSHALHRDVAAGVLPADARLTLMPLVQSFNDVTGACERIHRTPIPQSYSSYIKQFVLLYAFVMPFGLVEEFGYGTVIASMFTFFATMGLELLATEIEEPFGTDANDLPLETIAARIGRDVHELLRPALAETATA
jgi:putative membrane protein